jgi:glycosyltransferase involved in cell wall biosynthesis
MIVGGAQLNTLYTCRLLDRDKYRAEILTGPELGTEGDLLSAAQEEGIPTFIVPTLGREIRPWRDGPAYGAIRKHLHDGRYTVVHTHISKTGILGRHAAWKEGVPVIIHTAHGWQWTLARSAMMRKFIISCERWAARFADRIVVVAEGDREKGLREKVGRPDQYVVIESAIPLDEFDPACVNGKNVRMELGIPENAPVAGTVGRFAHPKAPDVMLRVAQRIIKDRDDAHFLYVGDGPMRESLLSRLGDFKSHPRLHLLGLRLDIAQVVAAMDVFLLSSSSEGLPRVVAEAMALRKPVVSTPAGAVPDLIEEGKTGHLVPFGRDDSLAEATLSLLENPSESQAMGDEGRRRVLSRFDVRKMVDRIEELYASVMAEKGVT